MLYQKVLDFICQKLLENNFHFLPESTCRLQSVEISSYEALPLVSHLESGVQKITVYPLENYTEELEQKNEIVLQDPAFSIEYLKKVWNDVF